MADADTKIAVHSLADLKNTSDDAIPTYLNSLKFTQSHVLSDVRLAIGYFAFAVAGAAFYWDYKLGFESTKYYTAAAVALYALLNSILTFWIWGVEKGKVYVGTSPSGKKIEIATTTKKHVPNYDLTIYTYEKGATTPNILKFSRPFTLWFDSVGHFVPLPFQQMLVAEVPMIAAADTRQVVKPGHKEVQLTPGLEEAILASQTSSTGASLGNATPRKGKSKSKSKA